jgi:hypothetical protein
MQKEKRNWIKLFGSMKYCKSPKIQKGISKKRKIPKNKSKMNQS